MSWTMLNGIWVSDVRDHTERADSMERKHDELSFRVAVLEKEIDDIKLLDSTKRLGLGLSGTPDFATPVVHNQPRPGPVNKRSRPRRRRK